MPESLKGKLGLGLFIYEEALKNIFKLFKSSPLESKTSYCPVSYPLKEFIYPLYVLISKVYLPSNNKVPDMNWHMI